MAQINPKITIRPVYFGILLSAAVMILAVRLTVAAGLGSLKAAAENGDANAQSELGIMYSSGDRRSPKRNRGVAMVSHGRRAGT